MGALAAAAGFIGNQAAGQGSGMLGSVGRQITQISNYISPNDMFGISDDITAYLSGNISKDQFIYQARLNGFNLAGININHTRYTTLSDERVELNQNHITVPSTAEQSILSNFLYYPSIDEVKLLLNRGLISMELARHMIMKQCSMNPHIAKAWLDTRFEIPGPSDLIRFAVREAFTPSQVEAFGYDSEFPKAILPWMAKQGYNGDTGIPLAPNATFDDGSNHDGTASWSDLYWRAHWELPSIGQGYEMLHRLYGNSDFGASPDATATTLFGSQDLENLQKAQDIPNVWRKRLQALSYSPYTRVDVRRMKQLGVLEDKDVYHAYRAIGYDDTRAKKLLQFTLAQIKDENKEKNVSATAPILCKYYKTGILTKLDLLTKLGEIGYTANEASLFASKCDAEREYEIAVEAIANIRAAFMKGILTPLTAASALQNFNMDQDHIDKYIQRWSLKRAYRTKISGAKQNIDYFKLGIITEDELTARLQNLEYANIDVTNMIVQAKVELLKSNTVAAQKEQQRIAKANEKALKEQQKLLKQEKKSALDSVKDKHNQDKYLIEKMLQLSSDKNLIEWYNDGLITLPQIITRFLLKDVPTEDIKRWIISKLKIPNEQKVQDEIQKAKDKQPKQDPSRSDA